MNELRIFNEEIIPVYKTDTSERVVIGRELHEKLGIRTEYKDWFPRMIEYGFEDGKDFSSFLSESTGGRPRKEHLLKFDMAKHIAMIQRTPIGMAIRNKLIELEKAVSQKDSYMIEDPIERAKEWIKEFKQGDIWLLYQRYADKGYTNTKTHPYIGSDGETHTRVHTHWTQK